MIRAQNLWKRFGSHKVLSGLSLSVREGSAYALIGANGAGKTTTIRVLMNIIQAERGTAEVMGVDSRRLSPAEMSQIGYVSENQIMPKRLTVSEYMDYLRPFYPMWDKTLETSLLSQLWLPPACRIGDLSHGMRMKLAMACALPFRPKVLILDEPLSGLDSLVRDEFLAALLQQAGEMTILISSHELSEIEGVATDVGFLEDGKLLFEESMGELTARFREVRVTLDWEPRETGNVPKEWLNPKTSGNVLMFVHSSFSEDRLSAELEALTGVPRTVDVQPMSLRSIFISLALAARSGAELRRV